MNDVVLVLPRVAEYLAKVVATTMIAIYVGIALLYILQTGGNKMRSLLFTRRARIRHDRDANGSPVE